MSRKLLQGSKMYVQQAATWSRELTRMKARGPGDLENAMRRLEREYGIDFYTTWKLRYRLSQVKDIGIQAYMAIANAYQAECERQRRKLGEEIRATSALAGAANPVVVSALAALGADEAAPVSPDDRG